MTLSTALIFFASQALLSQLHMDNLEEKSTFEEKFVEVKNGELIIKCYYFPIGIDKVIAVRDLRKMKYARQSESYVKNWGSNGMVWWACDMKRNFRKLSNVYYNVVVDNGDFFQKGFTVKDIVGFQRALRHDLYDCIIEKLVTM